VPTLLFGLRIATRDQPIRNITLRSQIRIEPARRGYDADEHERLGDLFGEKQRWGQTLRSFLWEHVNLAVPPFEGACSVKLPVACSHDFNVAATKYFQGLRGGEVPLSFLFSGAVFYDGPDGHLQIGQLSWNREARFALPLSVWRELMEHYYPDTNWLRLHNEVFEKLCRYRREKGLADWDQTLDSLISSQMLEASP